MSYNIEYDKLSFYNAVFTHKFNMPMRFMEKVILYINVHKWFSSNVGKFKIGQRVKYNIRYSLSFDSEHKKEKRGIHVIIEFTPMGTIATFYNGNNLNVEWLRPLYFWEKIILLCSQA